MTVSSRYFRPGSSGGGSAPHRPQQLAVDRPAGFHAEDIDPQDALEESLLGFDGFRIVLERGQSGVGRREEMIVYAQLVGAGEEFRSEVVRRMKRHVAVGAILLGVIGIIETAGAVPRHAAEQIRIVVILPAEKILVVIEFAGQAHLVAGRAEFGRLVKRLEEGLFVKLGLGLDQLVVDELQHGVGAVGEGILLRLLDRVVGVASHAVDVGDRMAGGASDAGLRGGIIHVVELGIVESPAEERRRIVATGAPPRGADAGRRA